MKVQGRDRAVGLRAVPIPRVAEETVVPRLALAARAVPESMMRMTTPVATRDVGVVTTRMTATMIRTDGVIVAGSKSRNH